jgi:hypothetical protein
MKEYKPSEGVSDQLGKTMAVSDKISAAAKRAKLKKRLKFGEEEKGAVDNLEKEMQGNQEVISLPKGASVFGYGKELEKKAPGSEVRVGGEVKLKKPKIKK